MKLPAENSDLSVVNNPEIVFGIVGPIGVDLDNTIKYLSTELKNVGYKTIPIHLTDYMIDPHVNEDIDLSSYYNKYKSLIKYANSYRKAAENKAAMAGLAIDLIRRSRISINGKADEPVFGHAFIIRQFKRPEEIDLMRRVYGRKFIQISIYSDENERKKHLVEKIRKYDKAHKSRHQREREAIDLIDIDFNERDSIDGQRISDVFHLGDVFIDNSVSDRGKSVVERFVKSFFGFNGSSPNKEEYGLYIATAASLRSIDLSRQVGAAIFSPRGEIISLGCNEVPKAGGGTYWCDDPGETYRDFEKGFDPNHERRDEILYDLINRMYDEKLFSNEIMSFSDKNSILEDIIKRSRIKDSQIMDIIEFGRIIHAEMSAISDAARNGRSTQGATLFCTTFPCHICTKHIIAAGISKVVFLEPYPKSYAEILHSDAITFNTKLSENKVLFKPFIGISPRRYRDIFEKKKRKDGLGVAVQWYENIPTPMIEDRSASYIENEEGAFVRTLIKFAPPAPPTE